MSFIIRIYRHITSKCGYVGVFGITCRTNGAVFGNYEIHSKAIKNMRDLPSH